MSRGFVKEGDQEEAPFIPPRAALPPGEENYVTENGYRELLAEKLNLEEELKLLPADETERRRASTILDGKLQLLNERISSARVINLANQPKDEVRFGAIVKFELNGKIQKFQIVGVDEAQIKNYKIAFTAPLSRAMIGAKVGECVGFQNGDRKFKIKILKIDYV